MRHAQPALKEAKFKKDLLEGLQPLRTVLADLEVDMRTNLNHSYALIRIFFFFFFGNLCVRWLVVYGLLWMRYMHVSGVSCVGVSYVGVCHV